MNKARILLVEDAAASVNDIARQLAAIGDQYLGRASHDEEALVLVEQMRPDLVLLDIDLGGPGKGVVIAETIHARFAVPVVFLAADSRSALTERATRAKAYGVVAKPCEEVELRMVLTIALHQRKMELLLQRSEERMRLMLDTSIVAFWLIDPLGHFKEVNDEACRLTGYTREELLHMNASELDPWRPQAAILAEIDEILRIGSAQIEQEMRRKDGQIIVVEINVSCPSGTEHLLYCFGRDMTARRQADARLRQLTSAVEQCPASIVITDIAANIVYVNPHFETITGYTAAEVIGKNPKILKSGAQSPKFYQKLWEALTEGRTWSGEFYNRRKDGTMFWEKASISPMRDTEDRITHYIAVKEDITPLKIAALDLARRESYLTAIIENHRGLVWLKDCDGRFLAVNRNFALACGLDDPSLVIGKTDFDIWPSDSAKFYREGDISTIHQGGSMTNEERIRIHGEDVWFEVYKTPAVDTEGKILGTAGNAVEITSQREARAELIRAKEAAESASHAKSAFLALMSHELRTPLNVINGVASTLLEQPLASAHRKALQLSLHSGENLLSIIEEILAFSAFQAGKTELDFSVFELVPLLHQVVRQAAELFAEKNLLITAFSEPTIPARIVGDARRLRQVLLNLVSNAAKFTDRGAVHLVVRHARGSDDRPCLHFSVVDTGIGIAPAHRALIFKPFTQADGSINRRFGGTGLGLAISHAYVKLMGGELRLRSRVGVGSVFHFTLPFDMVADTPPAPASPSPGCLQGRHLLVAVTIGKRRRLLADIARAQGMQVTSVDPVRMTAGQLDDAPAFDAALIEADALIPDSPLKSWWEARQLSAPLPALWLRTQDAHDDGASRRSITCPVDAAVFARELVDLIEGTQSVPATESVNEPTPLAGLIPLNILAADDVASNRMVLSIILSHLGYSGTLVDNGHEALAALRAGFYDLVLLDMQMPGMDGVTTAREINRLYSDPAHRPKLVALTANVLPQDREQCLAAGMDAFLGKPLVPAALAACIRNLFPMNSYTPVLPAHCGIDEAHLAAIAGHLPQLAATDILKQLHATVRADFTAIFPQVQAACADQQTDALHIAVHGLKGCFQTLGWSAATAGCVEALTELRAGKFTRWSTFPQHLHTLYENSRLETTRYLSARVSNGRPVRP